jgi:hypothetical protein
MDELVIGDESGERRFGSHAPWSMLPFFVEFKDSKNIGKNTKM